LLESQSRNIALLNEPLNFSTLLLHPFPILRHYIRLSAISGAYPRSDVFSSLTVTRARFIRPSADSARCSFRTSSRMRLNDLEIARKKSHHLTAISYTALTHIAADTELT